MALFDNTFGGETVTLKPEKVRAALKAQEERFGLTKIFAFKPTDVFQNSVTLYDGSAIKPRWIGEGERSPLARGNAAKVSVTPGKLSVTISYTKEMQRAVIADPEEWFEGSVMRSFNVEISAAGLGLNADGTNNTQFARSLSAVVPADADHEVALIANPDNGVFDAVSYQDAIAEAMNIQDGRGGSDFALLGIGASNAVRTTKSDAERSVRTHANLDALGFETLELAVDANLGRAQGVAKTTVGYVGRKGGFDGYVLTAMETEASAGAVADVDTPTLDDVVFEGQNGIRIRTHNIEVAEGVADEDRFVRLVIPAA